MDRRLFLKSSATTASLAMLPGMTAPNQQTNDANERDKIEASENHAVVETVPGKIRGYSQGAIKIFKGIPYGQTTEGENRFKPARLPEPWSGIRSTRTYGPVCPQKPNKGWASDEYAFLFQWNDGHPGEDCLCLNVWTPDSTTKTKRPVMFWIHGGAYFSGSSQEHPSYDGRNLSEFGDVVVVSINHRLNVFGFLDLSSFGTPYEFSGNTGMLDIVEALKWVRDNIRNFGGDPDNVTIFGQSGGAAKVTTLMAMPAAQGLFHKSIVQSTSATKVATQEYAQTLANLTLACLDITAMNLGEIHRVATARLVQASIEAEAKLGATPKEMQRSGWQPVVDGKIIPQQPFEQGVPEIAATIPMLIGSNRNEWSASIGMPAMESLDEEGLKKILQEKHADKEGILYKAIRTTHPKVKPVEILSFLNPYNKMAYAIAEKKAQQKRSDVYLYMFSWQTPLLDGRPRAFHCSEIPFVFYNTDRCETITSGSAEAKDLSAQMARAWVSFAHAGNPNHPALTPWPPFAAGIGQTMILDSRANVQNDPDKEFRITYGKM